MKISSSSETTEAVKVRSWREARPSDYRFVGSTAASSRIRHGGFSSGGPTRQAARSTGERLSRNAGGVGIVTERERPGRQAPRETVFQWETPLTDLRDLGWHGTIPGERVVPTTELPSRCHPGPESQMRDQLDQIKNLTEVHTLQGKMCSVCHDCVTRTPHHSSHETCVLPVYLTFFIIPIREEDRYKTAFWVNNLAFEFNVAFDS